MPVSFVDIQNSDMDVAEDAADFQRYEMKIITPILFCLIFSGCITQETNQTSDTYNPRHETRELMQLYNVTCGLANTNKTISLSDYYYIECDRIENTRFWNARDVRFLRDRIPNFIQTDDGTYREVVLCDSMDYYFINREFNTKLCNDNLQQK